MEILKSDFLVRRIIVNKGKKKRYSFDNFDDLKKNNIETVSYNIH
jgi:hypothetical protein